MLTKLDLTLISSASLGVMIRYLDQVNVNNAFSTSLRISYWVEAADTDPCHSCNRQWDEGRFESLWERIELCKCSMVCGVCFRTNSQ
jgi:hypothetical protein